MKFFFTEFISLYFERRSLTLNGCIVLSNMAFNIGLTVLLPYLFDSNRLIPFFTFIYWANLEYFWVKLAQVSLIQGILN